MTTSSTPAATWRSLTEMGKRVQAAVAADDPLEPLTVVRAITEVEGLDDDAQFVMGCFLLVLRASTEHFGDSLDRLTLRYRLLVNSEVEERVPTVSIVQAIREGDTRPLFIEATRLATFYMREHTDGGTGTEFFSSLYGASMALVLGDPELLTEPGIVDQIRGWELIEGDWHRPPAAK